MSWGWSHKSPIGEKPYTYRCILRETRAQRNIISRIRRQHHSYRKFYVDFKNHCRQAEILYAQSNYPFLEMANLTVIVLYFSVETVIFAFYGKFPIRMNDVSISYSRYPPWTFLQALFWKWSLNQKPTTTTAYF